MEEYEANMHYVHASQYFDDGNNSAAISECTTAISKGIQDARIYNTRAYAYIKQGEIQKACSDFEASLRLDPSDSWVRDMLNKLRRK